MKNIAEELKALYTKYPAEIVNAIVAAFWVKKQVVVTDGEEMPPTYIFEDGSTLRLEDLSTGRSKTFAGDLPVWIRPYARMNALFAVAELAQDNPKLAKQMLAAIEERA